MSGQVKNLPTLPLQRKRKNSDRTAHGIKKMSYFDDELEKDLTAFNILFEILEPEAHETFVSSINEKLPFSGSKIVWNTIKNSMSYAKSEKNKHSLIYQIK